MVAAAQQLPRSGEPDSGETAVDVSLIEELLALSPVERLRQNDRMATLAVKLRTAFEAGPVRWPSRES